LQTLGQDSFIEDAGDQIVVGRALTRENRSLYVDEGKNNRMLDSLVFGLDVVNGPVVLNVRVVSGNQ